MGACYRHFPSKEALIDQVIADSYRRYRDTLWKEIKAIPVGSFERVVCIGEAYIRFGLEHPDDYKILFLPRRGGPRKLVEIQGEENYAAFKRCITDAIASGEIAKEDPDLVTAFLWTRVHGIVMLLQACDSQ